MRILYLDPFSGISGDMFTGALLDAGLDFTKLLAELAKLKLDGCQITTSKVLRGVMAGTKFDVQVHGQTDYEDPRGHLELKKDSGHAHSHSHSHAHAHDGHGHEHSHSHAQSHGAAKNNPQSYAHIRARITGSTLSSKVKEQSLRAFALLAEAEGRMHGMPTEDVIFHEVGAADSIIDLVSACVGIELLGIEQVWCGPLALGGGGPESGYVYTAHGQLPVPAFATLDLIRGLPLRPTSVSKELTTPTGAALVRALATRFGPLPALSVSQAGYGAGTRNDPNIPIPNLLRVVIGDLDSAAPLPTGTLNAAGIPLPTSGGLEHDTVVEIHANLDDITPEVLGHVGERLLTLGALDYFHTPIQMKKNRPGTLLTVLAAPDQLDAVADLLFRETTTFGLRYEEKRRLKLARSFREVNTPFGIVRVKEGSYQGRIVSRHPEFEDCKKRAEEKGVPVRVVIAAAHAAAE